MMKPVGAAIVRPSSTVERPSMSLPMSGIGSDVGAVELGVFSVEVKLSVGKARVLVTETLP